MKKLRAEGRKMIKEYIKKRNVVYTQKDFAKDAGINATTLISVMNGNKGNDKTMKGIALAMDTHIDTITDFNYL